MTFQDLIAVSGDSYLEDYKYEDGVAQVVVKLDETDTKILIRVRSELMFFNVPEAKSLPYRTCYIELDSLSSLLSSKNGIHVPSDEFGKMMQEKRKNLNLAYGLRESDYKYILSFSASQKLVSFIIRDLEDVTLKVLEDTLP